MNHVMYADDIYLMAPSLAVLQELINIVYDFSVRNNLSFNPAKSYCVVFKLKSYKLSCLLLYMDSQVLKYVDNVKYLGFIFGSDYKDDNDILRQLRMLYTKSIILLRLFHHCSVDLKLALFCSSYTCFHCLFFEPITNHGNGKSSGFDGLNSESLKHADPLVCLLMSVCFIPACLHILICHLL